MKKLAVTQIALGWLIIGSLIFWSIMILPGYLTVEATVPQGDFGVSVWSNPGYAGPLEIWRIEYPLLGLLIVSFGIVQYVSDRRYEDGKMRQKGDTRLAAVQIALGTLAIASLIWFIGWAEFSYGNYIMIHDDVKVELRHAPGWYATMVSWKVVSFILGLAVAGCGVTQLMKVKDRLR